MALVALAVTTIVPAVAAHTAAEPGVLAVVSGQVIGVAQDSSSIAWLEAGVWGCRLHVHPLTGGADLRVRYAPGCLQAEHDLALAGGRAAWGGYEDVRCGDTVSDVFVASPLRERLVEEIPGDCLGYRAAYQGLASDGASFYYSLLVTSAPASSSNCGNGGACRWRLAGGRIVRIAGSRPVTVRGLPPAALIAADGGRVALVEPAASATWNGRHGMIDWPRAERNGRVEIRRTATHAAVTSFRPQGTVRAVALSATRAAVLVEVAGARRIEWYDAGSGARLGSGSVPGSTASRISTDGRFVAFTAGRTVRVLDLETGKQRIVAHATSAPVGLSVIAGRLVWGENTSTSGRIRSAKA